MQHKYLALCCISGVKTYVHVRLGKAARDVLDRLKRSTGKSESEVVLRGLYLVRPGKSAMSALVLVAGSVGRFTSGPKDLPTNQERLDGFGE